MTRLAERLAALAPLMRHVFPPVVDPFDPRHRLRGCHKRDATEELQSAASELSRVAADLSRPDPNPLLPDVTDAIEEIARILQ